MSETQSTTHPSADEDTQVKRVRTLSAKGAELYESTKSSLFIQVSKYWSETQDNLRDLSYTTDLDTKNQIKITLSQCFDNYCRKAEAYLTFLKQTNSAESLEEFETFSLVFRDNTMTYGNVITNKASSSTKSSSSRRSLTSVIAISRAKAEAAKVKAEYAKQEAELRKQRAVLEEQKTLSSAKATRENAELEAELELLAHKKEAAAAAAEVDVLESEDGASKNSEVDVLSDHEWPNQNINKEVSSAHALNNPNEHYMDLFTPQKLQHFHATPVVMQPAHGVSSVASLMPPVASHPIPPTSLNVNAEPFMPNVDGAYATERTIPKLVTTELTQFLLKKDLLLSRLTVYSDKPELYSAWKTSFKSVMVELSVNPNEELDLLVKWLGAESSKYAHTIRASNISNPQKGLTRLWERLDERYGAPELVEASLSNKIKEFPKLSNRDNKRFYELHDILSEIASVKEDPQYHSLLAYYDSSSGVLPIVNKLPHNIQEKWTTRASGYKKQHSMSFPPFSFFVDFIKYISKVRNDPSFAYDQTPPIPPKRDRIVQKPRNSLSVRKTDVVGNEARFVKKTAVSDSDSSNHELCPIHKSGHTLNQCRVFRGKPLQLRMKLLRQFHICFRCCDSTHMRTECIRVVKCIICGSDQHPSALHVNFDNDSKNSQSAAAMLNHGGEQQETSAKDTVVSVSTKCTDISQNDFNGKSCAKIIRVKVYHRDCPNNSVITYAIFDDQSNKTLAKSELLDTLGINGSSVTYTLSSCSGRSVTTGRIGESCILESLDGTVSMALPPIIECNDLPDIRDEIPTPQVASAYHHLSDISDLIPPLSNHKTLLLVGRDMIDAHHVQDQRIGPSNTPYGQKLPFGWVVIGETCVGKVHDSDRVNVNKIHFHSNGRPTVFDACENQFAVTDEIGSSVFVKTPDDNKLGKSIEDKEFLELMDTQFSKDGNGNWIAPLPFRNPRPILPNNRSQALKRAKNLHRGLTKDSKKMNHMLAFMQRVFDNNHAELAPPLKENNECWYLPIFGVYHPRKPDSIRAVFDSSALHDGISLNSVLLSGPDLTNRLVDVLLQFRKEPIAITGDIQQMFHSFLVREDHRNYLRFLWYKNTSNDPTEDLIEYRMRVHVFGNKPSPSVANYGLLRTARNSEAFYGSDVRAFIEKGFYVDDGLISLPTVNETVDLMKRTQAALQQEGNLRLHKIASNSKDVMDAFPQDDLAKDLKDLDFNKDDLPLQHSLGIGWNIEKDTFTFRASSVQKPYTRRGVLSVINSVFDPLGFAAPVVIQGKLILRSLMNGDHGWDDILPEEHYPDWELWRKSLQSLPEVEIRRTYMFDWESVKHAVRKELHIYSDASELAISAVVYMKCTSSDNRNHVGFVMGKAKVAPLHGHSIPRLELCGAVLGVELFQIVSEALDLAFDCVRFYTDSKVVLGYIHNRTRRFLMYVCNRVDRIRKYSKPEQWSYVQSESNPADCGTRGFSAGKLQSSRWLKGPSNLLDESECADVETYPLVNPEQDRELKSEVHTLKTSIATVSIGTQRFERFSTWKSLVNSIAMLRHRIACYKDKACTGWFSCSKGKTVSSFENAEKWIIQTVQRECFPEEIACLTEKKALTRSSSLLSLNPYIDIDGILRVGGRLRRSDISSSEKYPRIVPKRHHIALLLVRHYHELVKHQGRHFTDGAVRAAGYWILGGKRLISSMIRKCVKCLKLRGKLESQKMSDLPESRLDPAPPFTYVGVDVFGPWSVVARRTRGGQAHNKRWAVIFTCLVIRAIHIEVIEDMSSSSFISALRRFVSIRGPVKEFVSDRGTNFVGSTDDLKIDAVNVEDVPLREFLYNKGTVWKFNPPHSSHMGGVWERMIGTTRRILAAMMSDLRNHLTHEILVTFFAEVCGIVNARPLVPVSSDPENPSILSPSMILTQKVTSDVPSFDAIGSRDKSMWKRAQHLANIFWKRWRVEYLQSLQPRRKWQNDRPNLKNGEVVLLKQDCSRNIWPVGIVVNAIAGDDSRVRKAEVRVIRDNKPTVYTRPVTEMVLLVND